MNNHKLSYGFSNRGLKINWIMEIFLCDRFTCLQIFCMKEINLIKFQCGLLNYE